MLDNAIYRQKKFFIYINQLFIYNFKLEPDEQCRSLLGRVMAGNRGFGALLRHDKHTIKSSHRGRFLLEISRLDDGCLAARKSLVEEGIRTDRV